MSEKFVHVDVFVDITDPEQIAALSTFLTKVGQNAKTVEATPTQTEPEAQPEKPAKQTKPAKPAKAPKAEPESQPEKPAETQSEPETAPEKEVPFTKVEQTTYQIEEVREKLKEKVSEHREEIKAKLTELGAPNVSSLDPSKYTEFVNFLEGLE